MAAFDSMLVVCLCFCGRLAPFQKMDVAQKLAENAMVLLQNNNAALPLDAVRQGSLRLVVQYVRACVTTSRQCSAKGLRVSLWQTSQQVRT